MCLHRELDVLALTALEAGRLTVDVHTGAIWRPGNRRAELLDKRYGYGRVIVNRYPLRQAMAHRIVWIAAHGMLMPHQLVEHRNAHLWDNRLDNLYLTEVSGDTRPGRLVPYLQCPYTFPPARGNHGTQT